jgi:hypothetical protein
MDCCHGSFVTPFFKELRRLTVTFGILATIIEGQPAFGSLFPDLSWRDYNKQYPKNSPPVTLHVLVAPQMERGLPLFSIRGLRPPAPVSSRSFLEFSQARSLHVDNPASPQNDQTCLPPKVFVSSPPS